MRLTMKPGVSAQATGVLPQARAVSYARVAYVTSVANPETTSTSGSSGAGLKKCRPTKRPGERRAPPMAVTDRDEVLVASRQSSATMSSSPQEQVLFDVQPLQDRLDDQGAVRQLGEVFGGQQPGAGGVPVGAGEPVLLDEPVQPGADRVGGLPCAPGDGVVQPYGMARDQRDLGDSLAHGAGADDGHGAAEVECCHVRDPPARGFPQMRRTPLNRPIVRLL
ncbi:hypothetical protein SGRIM128S_01961 [Streptomyces griseomycini]